MPKNLSVSVEFINLKELKFSGVSYSTWFLRYDLTALGFPVETFLHGGIEKMRSPARFRVGDNLVV